MAVLVGPEGTAALVAQDGMGRGTGHPIPTAVMAAMAATVARAEEAETRRSCTCGAELPRRSRSDRTSIRARGRLKRTCRAKSLCLAHQVLEVTAAAGGRRVQVASLPKVSSSISRAQEDPGNPAQLVYQDHREISSDSWNNSAGS
jgi:hypothetical protein